MSPPLRSFSMFLALVSLNACNPGSGPDEGGDATTTDASTGSSSLDETDNDETDGSEGHGDSEGSSGSEGSDNNETTPSAVVLAEEGFVIFASSGAVQCDQSYERCGYGSAVRVTLPAPVEVGVYDVSDASVDIHVVESWYQDCSGQDGGGGSTSDYPLTGGQVEVLGIAGETITFRMLGLTSDESPDYPELADVTFEAEPCT
ncbi:MAG: hypothetical protein ACRBN8_34265 [Nannocystales bacterium]